MSILICKNIQTEGPGTIEDFLRSGGIHYTIVDLSKGESLPDTGSFDTLVMLGGPMSVNESSIFTYITREEELVRTFVSRGKRVFGVCLGAQIMAKALGSRVYKGAQKEIGWYDIEITNDGIGDPIMLKLCAHPSGDLRNRFKVFHWHGETFDIPAGAVRLAGSALFPNQAFRYGKDAYAFQFHIEVKKEMIYEWLKEEKEIDLNKIRSETEELYSAYHGRALEFYKAFFKPAR